VATWKTSIALGRTTDGRIVPADDPESAFLYVGPGADIPLADAEAAGLVPHDEPVEPKMAPAPTNKIAPKPPNKMARTPRNKTKG
jgi:hypothetical protein